MLRKLSKLDMMNYLCLIVIAISYIHHTDAQSCDAFSGPDGARLCVKVDGYDDYQWVTCRTDDYLRTTSGGRHFCLFHFIHEFCLYQCMLEKHDKSSGTVTDSCRCTPDSTTPTSASPTLASQASKSPDSTSKTSASPTLVSQASTSPDTDAQSCDAFSGPDGARLCVKVDGYDDYQWVTCRTDDYLRTTSGGRHFCLFHFIHEFCLYQCMLEKHDKSSGTVTDSCRCTPDSTTPTSASPTLASQASTSPDATPKTSTPPNSTSPDSTSPNSTSPDSTSPNSTSPDSTSPNSTSPDSTSKTSGSKNSASSEKIHTFVFVAVLEFMSFVFLF